VDDTTPVERQNQKYIECPKGNGWNREKVDGDHISHVVEDEGLPGLIWWAGPADHLLADGCLADFEAKLEQLTVDSRRAPERVLQ